MILNKEAFYRLLTEDIKKATEYIKNYNSTDIKFNGDIDINDPKIIHDGRTILLVLKVIELSESVSTGMVDALFKVDHNFYDTRAIYWLGRRCGISISLNKDKIKFIVNEMKNINDEWHIPYWKQFFRTIIYFDSNLIIDMDVIKDLIDIDIIDNGEAFPSRGNIGTCTFLSRMSDRIELDFDVLIEWVKSNNVILMTAAYYCCCKRFKNHYDGIDINKVAEIVLSYTTAALYNRWYPYGINYQAPKINKSSGYITKKCDKDIAKKWLQHIIDDEEGE